MSTKVNCPSCAASLRISPDKAGHLLRCHKCQKTFRVGAVGAAAPAAPKAAPKASPRPAAAPRPSASRTGGGHRPARPPVDTTNETLLGAAAPTRRTAATPPPDDDPAPVPQVRKGGGCLRSALLGSLLVLLLSGGALGGLYFWKPELITSHLPGNSGPQVGATLRSGGGTETAADPALGKWGAIEIGSKGVKAVVIDIFLDEGGNYDFNPSGDQTADVTLVGAAADGQAFDPKVLDAAVDHVKKFAATMREEGEVPPEHMYVLCSSGLWVPFKNPNALAKNQALLAERVKAATGCSLIFNKVADEVRLGMNACVPRKQRDETLFLDIGSGNTKGGFFEKKDVFQVMSVDFGSKTYTDKVKAEAKLSGKPFAEQAAELRPALLEQPLRKQIDDIPGLANPKKVYLVGGAVWALATFMHPEDSNLRTPLTAADVERYAALVRKPKDQVRNEVLSHVKDPEQFKKTEKEITRVQNTFNPENLQAGAEILKALSKEYDFESKQLVFFRKGHIAWSVGYVLENNVKK
ncbi:MAG TPA: hypothetical protein VKA46_32970 [Gemmataceae bacterium]|nr:hypothetical protein [Gemmataceae bacterium]